MSKPSKLTPGPGGVLTYANGLLVLTVLGGVKLEGLDRLRVTLKIEVPDSPRPPIRHNLDLYNDNQVGKLVRVVAQRLEVGMSVTEASVAELIEELEAWRLAEIQRQGEQEETIQPLSEAEEAQAREDLKREGLLQWTGERLGESGIVGEERNRLVLFIVMVSRLLGSPLSAVCMARSGVGKSHLMEKVAQCMPDPAKLECTQLTPTRARVREAPDVPGARLDR